jgi:hypothetical protein
MAAQNPRLADLSDDDRLVLESWLVEFDQRWDEGLLANRVEQIPSAGAFRSRPESLPGCSPREARRFRAARPPGSRNRMISHRPCPSSLAATGSSSGWGRGGWARSTSPRIPSSSAAWR